MRRYALVRMPELPEVETIARDLRGLVTGARIAGASSNWPPTLRSHEPAAFAAAISGRAIVGVGRRGKQLLVWLGPALPSPAAPPVSELSAWPLLYAVPFGLLVWFAMGVDFPESNRRFSRLA